MGYLSTWSGGSQGSSSVESSSTWPLSRDSSTDTASFTDSTGTDLEAFIVETLHKNHKERSMMLRLEQDLVALLNDRARTSHKFLPMTSYHRMIVHRCAAFFGLDHNVDTSGQSVIVSKTKHSRLPDRRFHEYLNSPPLPPQSSLELLTSSGGRPVAPGTACRPFHWTSDPAMLSVKKLNILKRDSSKEKESAAAVDRDPRLVGAGGPTTDETAAVPGALSTAADGRPCWLLSGPAGPGSILNAGTIVGGTVGGKNFQGLEGRRCRSMEEREEHYNLVRERIFKGGSLDDRTSAATPTVTASVVGRPASPQPLIGTSPGHSTADQLFEAANLRAPPDRRVEPADHQEPQHAGPNFHSSVTSEVPAQRANADARLESICHRDDDNGDAEGATSQQPRTAESLEKDNGLASDVEGVASRAQPDQSNNSCSSSSSSSGSSTGSVSRSVTSNKKDVSKEEPERQEGLALLAEPAASGAGASAAASPAPSKAPRHPSATADDSRLQQQHQHQQHHVGADKHRIGQTGHLSTSMQQLSVSQEVRVDEVRGQSTSRLKTEQTLTSQQQQYANGKFHHHSHHHLQQQQQSHQNSQQQQQQQRQQHHSGGSFHQYRQQDQIQHAGPFGAASPHSPFSQPSPTGHHMLPQGSAKGHAAVASGGNGGPYYHAAGQQHYHQQSPQQQQVFAAQSPAHPSQQQQPSRAHQQASGITGGNGKSCEYPRDAQYPSRDGGRPASGEWRPPLPPSCSGGLQQPPAAASASNYTTCQAAPALAGTDPSADYHQPADVCAVGRPLPQEPPAHTPHGAHVSHTLSSPPHQQATFHPVSHAMMTAGGQVFAIQQMSDLGAPAAVLPADQWAVQLPSYFGPLQAPIPPIISQQPPHSTPVGGSTTTTMLYVPPPVAAQLVPTTSFWQPTAGPQGPAASDGALLQPLFGGPVGLPPGAPTLAVAAPPALLQLPPAPPPPAVPFRPGPSGHHLLPTPQLATALNGGAATAVAPASTHAVPVSQPIVISPQVATSFGQSAMVWPSPAAPTAAAAAPVPSIYCYGTLRPSGGQYYTLSYGPSSGVTAVIPGAGPFTPAAGAPGPATTAPRLLPPPASATVGPLPLMAPTVTPYGVISAGNPAAGGPVRFAGGPPAVLNP